MSSGDAKPMAAGALDISAQAELLGDSQEFLRMWNQPGGPAFCFIDPAKLGADPALFGIALMDCVRHGAKAWSHATGVPEGQVLGRILAGFDAERAAPTDMAHPLISEGDTH